MNHNATSNQTSSHNAQPQKPAATRNGTYASSLIDRSMPTLDWIHIIFLLFSASHNFINAWHHSENALFFLFVVIGILSVELMLWTIYKHWKDGRLIGKMQQIAKYAGLMAMFYATAGILAKAQAGNASEWITIYYNWILPSSAPCMFFFAFLIQAVDPVMTAERDAVAYAQLLDVEERRDELDKKRLVLDERRDFRRLQRLIHNDKLAALMKEAISRRVRFTLKSAARIEMPRLLRKMNVPIDKIKAGRFSILNRGYQLPAASEEEEEEGKS